MVDKLPETAVKRIDEDLAVHQRAWNNLKRRRRRLSSSRELDQAFYD